MFNFSTIWSSAYHNGSRCGLRFNNKSNMSVLLLSVIPLLLALVTNAEAARLKPLKLGQWEGGIYVNDKTGRFSHCVVSASYKSGIRLLFSVTRGQHWSMGFAKNGWKLELGETYPVLYQVDKRKIQNGKAKARGKSLAVVELPAETAIFNQMRRGRILRVKAGNDILSFKLTGTNKVLSALLRCSKKYNDFIIDGQGRLGSNTGQSDNPFAAAKPEAPNNDKSNTPHNEFAAKRPVPSEEKIEAKAWFNKHLINSQIKNRIIPENDHSAKHYRTYALLWVSGPNSKTVGSLRILDNEQTIVFGKRFPARRKSLCDGEYTFKKIPNEIESSQRVWRFVATCDVPDKPLKTFYHMLAERKNGGSYFVSLISDKVSTASVVRTGNGVAFRVLTNSSVIGGKNANVRKF